MQHIKMIRTKRQSRHNVQHAKVLHLQEVDLGGHGLCHVVHSSDEVGHVAHQNDQHEEAT